MHYQYTMTKVNKYNPSNEIISILDGLCSEICFSQWTKALIPNIHFSVQYFKKCLYILFYSTVSPKQEKILRGWKTNVEDGIRVDELCTIIIRITEITNDVLEKAEITTASLSWSSSGKNIYSHDSICHNVNKNSSTYSWLIQLYGHQADLAPLTSVIWDTNFIYFHINLDLFLSF